MNHYHSLKNAEQSQLEAAKLSRTARLFRVRGEDIPAEIEQWAEKLYRRARILMGVQSPK